jgi:hypothetical protein
MLRTCESCQRELELQVNTLVDIACFVETYNFFDNEESEALERFQKVA